MLLRKMMLSNENGDMDVVLEHFESIIEELLN
jgi:hypothetical protein